MPQRKIYLILAKNHKFYREEARRIRAENSDPVACVFANSTQRMRGIEPDEIVTGTHFWDRNDAVELAQAANRKTQ